MKWKNIVLSKPQQREASWVTWKCLKLWYFWVDFQLCIHSTRKKRQKLQMRDNSLLVGKLRTTQKIRAESWITNDFRSFFRCFIFITFLAFVRLKWGGRTMLIVFTLTFLTANFFFMMKIPPLQNEMPAPPQNEFTLARMLYSRLFRAISALLIKIIFISIRSVCWWRNREGRRRWCKQCET